MSSKKRGGEGGERKRTGFGSRPDLASDQTPGKTPEEKAQGPVPPDRVKTPAKAGIGRLPDPKPGGREHPQVERPDWPPFRDHPAGQGPTLGGVGGGEQPATRPTGGVLGAPPDDVGEDVGAERGSTKTGPSSTGARQGGEGRDTQDRTRLVDGGPGIWKNPGQGFGDPAGPGRSFGNQPDIKEGDEVAGPELPPGGSPAAGRKAGGRRVTQQEPEEPESEEPEEQEES